MPFEILPIDPKDAPRLITIYFAAFQNAHSLACWPRIPSVRQWWEDMVLDELKDPNAVFLKVVDTDSTDGQGSEESSRDGRQGPEDQSIVAWAKWNRPKDGETPDTGLPEWPEGADVELCNRTFGVWAQEHVNITGSRGHWYLEMLGTDPVHQGKGAGSMLMKWGLERADQEGKEAYLDASPDAVPLYQRFGFEEKAVLDTRIKNERVQGGKEVMYRNSFMLRPPRASQGRVLI